MDPTVPNGKDQQDFSNDIAEKEPLNVGFQTEDTPKKDEAKKEPSIPYYKLFRYATALDKLFMFLGIIFTIIVGVGQPYLLYLFSMITGDIVNYASNFFVTSLSPEEKDALGKKLYEEVFDFAIKTTVLGVATIVAQYFAGILFSYSGLRQIYKIRQNFFEKTMNQDIEWYDLNQTGDFATTFTENLMKIEEGIGDKVTIFLFYQTVFVTGIIWALVLGWKLALVCLVSLPLSTIIMGLISWLSTKFAKLEMESYAAAGCIAEEVFSAIRTVIAFDGQKKEIERYKVHLVNARENNIKRSLFNGFSNACLWFFVYACYALSFWYGVGLVLEERHIDEEDRVYTAGVMVAVFFNTLCASWNFGMGAPFFQIFGVACGAASKVFRVLDSEPKINASLNHGEKLKSFKGEIKFENVFFQYPSRPDVKILQGISLKIEPGQSVALVGSSGCGKSTCVQLLQRFYDTCNGEIYIDNINIKEYDLSWLRNKIGMVGQEPALFATSIAENIRYGKLSATQEEIERAAKRANVHKFIKSLPNGYDTLIGERGAQLSGGQKQRVAIARALVREPSILLLDEATSALDTTSEAEVQAALDAISGECTTIIVAHRLSTIKNANKIVVLSDGQILEEGTHSALLEAKGAYFDLMKTHRGDETTKRYSTAPELGNGFDPSKRDSIFDVQRFHHRKSEVDQIQGAGSKLIKTIKMNGPEWFPIFIGCAASLVTGAAMPIYSVVFGDLLGVLANEDDIIVRTETNKFCLYFLIIGIVSGIAYLAQIYAFGIAGEHLTFRVRSKMFAAMLQQEIGWYDRKENGVGSLCAKLSSDASNIQGASGLPIGTALNSISTLILSNTFALYFEWRLALVLMSFAPLIFLSVYFEQKILQGDTQENEKMLENSAKIAVEAIGNIRTVASLGCQKVFLKLYIEQLLPYQSSAKKKSHYRAFALGMAKSLMFFAYAAGMSYGVKLIIEEDLDYGIVFKVAECVIVGSWSIGNAFAFAPNFHKGLSSAGRMFELLSRVPKIRNVAYPSNKSWDVGQTEYSRVYFSYPTRSTVPVLQGLDLSVLAGKTIALVGSSGCGKSTIISLLERFYSPTSGEVTVDDVDIKNMDLQNLRAHLGMVSQEPNLFDRTIAENVAYGDNRREVTMSEIVEASKNANIHNFINSLPLGYQTRLGTKGAQLSGGQKQRVAIARALIKNPKVLLLDEATSALDNESEKIVQEALDNAKKGRTCITIAHRLTTIRDADLICVLAKGKIVEMGTHKELIEKHQYYYNFYKLQANH